MKSCMMKEYVCAWCADDIGITSENIIAKSKAGDPDIEVRVIEAPNERIAQLILKGIMFECDLTRDGAIWAIA